MAKKGVGSHLSQTNVFDKAKEFVIVANPITRILASTIDFLIINIIIFSPFKRVFNALQELKISIYNYDFEIYSMVYSYVIPIFLLIIAYFVIFEFLIQQTPGKMISGIYVESLKTKDRKPTLLQCILKNIILFPILPFVILWIIDIIFLFGKEKTRFSEKILGLRTVEKRIFFVNNKKKKFKNFNYIIVILFLTLFLFFFAKDVSAGFNISYDCIEDYCYEGKDIVWKVIISNEGLEKIIVSKIIIMDSNNKIISETTGSEIESDSYKNFVLRSKIPKADNFTTFYFRPCFKIKTNESEEILRCYELMNLTVMPYPLKYCKSNFDCEENRYCNYGMCFNLSCDYCSYVYNHSCLKHECCRDYECKEDEVCINNKCVFLNCNFDEEFKNHACLKLKCGFLKKPIMHKCDYPKNLKTIFRLSLVLGILILILLIIIKTKVKGENILVYYRKQREINHYKRLERESLKKAEIHYKLLKYLKDKESIEKHKKLIEKYEKEANNYRKKWQKYFKNIEICPVCENEVPKGYEFCPYCNAKLR